ncbi:MAG TPA: nucleotide exchange factor GrpE [bacterium]|nr:nucleotide exchange factor GrpE [bacterium]
MSTEPSKKNSKALIQELTEKYQRALADQQNLVKQHQKEKAHYIHYANEQLLLELLPVFDNLKLSCRHFNPDNTTSWLEGINYIIKQFENFLNQQGVTEIKAAGQAFNHATMDAAEMVETTDEKLDNLVAEEIKPGYQLADKIITPARVKVYQYKDTK